jgi:NAD(P)-dependent dehydrogenase (short-subunit alcohol dehydrogenase family)
MGDKLKGQIALITGGSRGIGYAIATTFSREGAHVVIADIRSEAAAAAAKSLPTKSLGIEMDVSSKHSVTAGFSKLMDEFGDLDILVNNAGILELSTFEDCDEGVWDRTIAVNLKGTFLCSQAAYPILKERSKGAIVNLTSLAGKTGGLAAGPPYGAAKAGVLAMTLALARGLAPYGVRANGIAPGIIDTEMTDNPLHAKLSEQIPLGKKGTSQDVANCALFLASEDSAHITGEIIDVNGGMLMD